MAAEGRAFEDPVLAGETSPQHWMTSGSGYDPSLQTTIAGKRCVETDARAALIARPMAHDCVFVRAAAAAAGPSSSTSRPRSQSPAGGHVISGSHVDDVAATLVDDPVTTQQNVSAEVAGASDALHRYSALTD